MHEIFKHSLMDYITTLIYLYLFYFLDFTMFSLPEDARHWISCHYILNIIACIVYVILKVWEPSCLALFGLNENGKCELGWRDTEVLMFLAIVIVLKNRKWKPLTAVEYVSNIFLFGKLANFLLFFREDLRWCFVYGLFCLVLFIAFPEPTYSGPEKITYFRGQALDEHLRHNSEEIWVVEFFAPWSPPCTRFASTFAKLSLDYSHKMLKFGKLDVNKYTKIGQNYKIDPSVSSKNLPTVIVFENGKEKSRRPLADADGVIKPYQFKEQNLIQDLNLNELYAKAKQTDSQKSKKKN